MSARVILDRSAPLSPHIKPLCAEAKDSTYVRDVDLKALGELPGNWRLFVRLLLIPTYNVFVCLCICSGVVVVVWLDSAAFR